MPSLEISWILLAVGALAFAAFVQGFSGFGYGILAMGIISLFAPNAERVSVVVTMTGICVQATLAGMNWRGGRIDWRTGGLLLMGMAAGIPPGYFFLLHTGQNPQPLFRIVFGGVLVTFAINGLVRPHLRRNIHAAWAPPVGLLGGCITGAFASGGPPLVIYLYAREHDPRLARGTLQMLFLSGSLIRLFMIGSAGAPITSDLLVWVAIGAPTAVGITLIGHWLGGKVSINTFRLAIYTLIVVAGGMQIAKGLE